MAPILLVVLLAGLFGAGCATPPALAPGGQPNELRHLVVGLHWTMDDAERSGLLTLASADDVVQRREELVGFVARFYELGRGLDALGAHYDQQAGAEAFLLQYTAELAFYLELAHLMRRTVGRSHYEVVLGESRPELGYAAAMYQELKNAFNLQPWHQPLALFHLRYEASLDEFRELGLDRRHRWALSFIEEHRGELVQSGIVTGPDVFSRDVLQRLTESFHWVWFPAQRGLAEGMGDTRVVPAERRLVSDEQIARATVLLRPGDIVFERRNWYLSNIGLPGFWPHVALYVGTPEQVRAELGPEYLTGLERSAPLAAQAWRRLDPEGHPLRLLEAVSEGVVFTSAEHSLGADFVAAVRPSLDAHERGALLREAFRAFGRPYDFDFDFRTDAALVCSELVYKAYRVATPERANPLPLQVLFGRPVLSPNEWVAHYDRGVDGETPPFRFVFFLDGVERERRAHFRDERSFRQSHLRPKWDVVQP